VRGLSTGRCAIKLSRTACFISAFQTLPDQNLHPASAHPVLLLAQSRFKFLLGIFVPFTDAGASLSPEWRMNPHKECKWQIINNRTICTNLRFS